MRRREKFVIASFILSIAMLALQSVPIEWRYLTIGGFMILSYLAAIWVLWENLNAQEWFTVAPMPGLFAGSVAFFYILLPDHFISRVVAGSIFATGMYALLLSSNIYAVSKGRTIQLLHAAHAVGFFFTLVTSLFYTNTIYSSRLPFYINALLVALVHWPLIYMSLWSVQLRERIMKEVVMYTTMITLILTEFAVLFSFLPLTVWHSSLFILSILYVMVSFVRSVLLGRLFARTFAEYALATVFIVMYFIVVFPLK